MSRRKHHQPSTRGTGTASVRTPALLIAISSLLLSAGLATCLYVFTEALEDQLDGDLDQAGVVAWWAADAGYRWALVSSVGSLAGVVGILVANPALHRVFAVSTFADLLLTVVLTFTLALLTLTPSLAPTFGSFLCSSVLSSSYDGPTSSASHFLRVERDSHYAPAGGIDLLSWGVEACEESWRAGMLQVVAGSVVAVALRIYGVYVSWEMNASLRNDELWRSTAGRDGGESCWEDDEGDEVAMAQQQQQHRRRNSAEMRQFNKSADSGAELEYEMPTSSKHRRSRSAGSQTMSPPSRRSNTLPATGLPPRYSDPSASRPRSQSSSASSTGGHRPRLVLLPVYVDRDGNPIGSPSRSSPPAYRSRSSTSPPASPVSPSRSKYSAPPSSPSSHSRPPPPPRKRSHSAAYPSSSSLSSSTSKRAPVAHWTDEPLSLSSSGSTTPTCTTNSSTAEAFNTLARKTLVGTSRRSRHRSETDAYHVPPPLPSLQTQGLPTPISVIA